MLAAGAVAFRWFVVPRARLGRALDAPLGMVVSASAAILALVTVPRAWLQASALSLEPGDAWKLLPRVLATSWGTGATYQAVAAVVMVVGTRFARRKDADAGWALCAAAALVLAATPAMMGHANAVEGSRRLSLAMDFLHVVAAGAWIGGLLPLAFVARAGEGDATAALIRAFHALAMTAAIVVAGTGVGAVLVRFGGVGPLLHSGYGALLGIKVALVAVVLAFGARHYRSGERDAAAGTVARSLAVEFAIAVAVIGATAILVATDPPTAHQAI